MATAAASPYDLSVSTAVFYTSAANPGFCGPFAASRARLDHDWHRFYSPQRQATQDGIIAAILAKGRASPRPWLVYTAGPMGAGAWRRAGSCLCAASAATALPHLPAPLRARSPTCVLLTVWGVSCPRGATGPLQPRATLDDFN